MSKQFSFGAVPTIKARRTKFDLSYNVKTSMNVGTLYPIYLQEVVPGDTFKVDSSVVTRVTSSYLKPVMDNIYQDVYFFFVASRLVYDKWAELFGENTKGAWANTEDVSIPRLRPSDNVDDLFFIGSGTVGDYFGLPVFGGISPLEYGYDVTADRLGISLLPFRAFALIWNDWFRDENNVDPCNIVKGDAGQYEVCNSYPWSPTNYTGKLPQVAKFHDYFTSCLPSPQKGDAVELSLATGFLPLIADDVDNLYPMSGVPRFSLNLGSNPESSSYSLHLFNARPSNSGSLVGSPEGNPSAFYGVNGSNLGVRADSLNAVSVNDLRYAFQLQKLLEKDARGGTRYVEYILSHFGVTSPDARLQNPEFLGGKRIPLNVQQVAQTNAPNSVSMNDSLGSLSAYSLTNGSSRFSKGFTEHGFIIGVSCLRYKHSYQQGLEKFWTRHKRTDFYDPVFANIGEQPVYKSELYCNELLFQEAEIDEPFGYNEAWADMRFRRNQITGQMRSNVENSLDIWHFADNYDSVPFLNQEFIEETPIYVNRTLAVDSDVQDQFIVDIYHNVEAIREMPLYSIPGLIDHH